MVYPIPENESDRLTALDAYDVVGTPPEMNFDEIAELAGQICGCPVAVINLVADKWEWYKGKFGIPEDACAAALDIRDYMARVNVDRDKMGLPHWEIRIGLHTGGVIGGVVGKKKFAYDIWGDAVNMAAMMEANTEPGNILLSDSTANRVRDRFETKFRDEIVTDKKGHVRSHVLMGPKNQTLTA